MLHREQRKPLELLKIIWPNISMYSKGRGGKGGGNMQTNRDIVMQHANYLNIYELPAKPSQAELR